MYGMFVSYLHEAQASVAESMGEMIRRSSSNLNAVSMSTDQYRSLFATSPKNLFTAMLESGLLSLNATSLSFQALSLYINQYTELHSKTAHVITRNRLERRKAPRLDSSTFNALFGSSRILSDMVNGTTIQTFDYFTEQFLKLMKATASGDPAQIVEFWRKTDETLDIVANKNPEALRKIQKLGGLPLDDPSKYTLVAKTPLATVYRVRPLEPIDEDACNKNIPVMFSYPLILGQRILALAPPERSLIHAVAEEFPAYIICPHNILTSRAVQEMGGEEFAINLKSCAELIGRIHELPVIDVEICQAAYFGLLARVSKRLNITQDIIFGSIGYVPPYDLTKKSPDKKNQMNESQIDLEDLYFTIRETGIEVVLGEAFALASQWEAGQNPWSRLIDDLIAAAKNGPTEYAQAVQAYLQTTTAMPVKMTEMSALGATVPIDKYGKFPVQLFGEDLYIGDLQGLQHIVIGRDDQVSPRETSLAVLPFFREGQVTVEELPGGHLGPMTSHTKKRSPFDIRRPGGVMSILREWQHQAIARKSNLQPVRSSV